MVGSMIPEDIPELVSIEAIEAGSRGCHYFDCGGCTHPTHNPYEETISSCNTCEELTKPRSLKVECRDQKKMLI